MLGLVIGLIGVIAVTPLVYFLAGPNAAWAFSQIGTVIVLASTMAYIVFWHSKTRWPNVGAFTRFSRVITFYRGE